MSVKEQIKQYIAGQAEQKRGEIQELHKVIVRTFPKAKLWFDTGINSENKRVANPNIGYGAYTIKYADGRTREFFQIGLSANTTGISVYVLGIKDKKYLSENFGKTIGKASVTGYCIKFKSLKDINIDVLVDAMRYGVKDSLRA